MVEAVGREQLKKFEGRGGDDRVEKAWGLEVKPRVALFHSRLELIHQSYR